MAYGLAGTPTVQHLRDYAFTSVSGIGPEDIVGATTAILPDVSSLAGCDENSQYVLWGVTCCTASPAGTSVFEGYIIHTGVSHTAYDGPTSSDDAVIMSFATSKEGPFFYNADHPISVPKGAGVSVDANGPTSNCIVIVYYTIKK